MLIPSSKSPIMLLTNAFKNIKNKSNNKINKSNTQSTNYNRPNDNFKQKYEEYLARIPKLSSEEQNKYINFFNKMLNDLNKALKKILIKFPKVKDAYYIFDLDFIIEYEDANDLNEFIYIFFNNDSKNDSFIISHDKSITIGGFSIEREIYEIKENNKLNDFDYKNTYMNIRNALYDDREFVDQFNESLLVIENELSKIGYGKIYVDGTIKDGIICIDDLTNSPKYKQFLNKL